MNVQDLNAVRVVCLFQETVQVVCSIAIPTIRVSISKHSENYISIDKLDSENRTTLLLVGLWCVEHRRNVQWNGDLLLRWR